MRYVGALDQGTTSTRFIIFNENFVPVSDHQLSHRQITPNIGFLEHDPLEIYINSCKCIVEAVNKLRLKDSSFRKLEGIGIANQRETAVAWDSQTHRPLYNAIVWSDARTSEIADRIKDQFGKGDMFFAQSKTGLPVSTYFSAFKFSWILENIPEVRRAKERNTLRFGTIDSWLMYKFSGCKDHVTDVTNASRTFLMDIKTLQWSPELCKMFDIPLESLPKIKSNSELFTTIRCVQSDIVDVLKFKTPITGSIGDQQASLVGNACFNIGEAKNTYGTGCFLLMNTGGKPHFSTHGLLTTCGFKLGEAAPCNYALEGSIGGAGAAIEWMSKNLGFYNHPHQVEAIARTVQSTEGIVFVPAFSGLLAPYWNASARGTILGMTYKTTKAHIIRAALQAIAQQVADAVWAMEKDSGVHLPFLRVDGGLSKNRLLMELQSDILGVEIHIPEMKEITALGAAMCAGLAVGIWKGADELALKIASGGHWENLEPCDDFEGKQRLKDWKNALKQCSWSHL